MCALCLGQRDLGGFEVGESKSMGRDSGGGRESGNEGWAWASGEEHLLGTGRPLPPPTAGAQGLTRMSCGGPGGPLGPLWKVKAGRLPMGCQECEILGWEATL